LSYLFFDLSAKKIIEGRTPATYFMALPVVERSEIPQCWGTTAQKSIKNAEEALKNKNRFLQRRGQPVELN